jgi:uncharacterized protein YjiS (DUF1127 family)
VRIGAEQAEAGTMLNDTLGIGQPAANADTAARPSETMLRRMPSSAGRWFLRALSRRNPDLSTFSDAQLRDIGLTRLDVDPFR